MVTKNCWHNRPVFSFVVSILQGLDYMNHLTALVFLAEVSWPWWGQCKAPASSPILPHP